MHKRIVFYVISLIIRIESLFLLFPFLWALKDDIRSSETFVFGLMLILGIFVSTVISFFYRTPKKDFERITIKDCFAIAGLSWIVMSAFGALPLYLTKVVPTFTDAFFEIASGFTTTGASIFSDVEVLPRGILFWRSLTHWMGGMGIIVLYIALLPALGGSNFQLFRAEASGLTVDRTATRIRETARDLWVVYTIFTIIGVTLLFIGGMSFFDALCHAFGAIATGGFSTKNISIGAYNPFCQWVIVFLMLAGGINFILHYHALKGKPLNYLRDQEFKFYCTVVLVNITIVAFVLFLNKISQSPVRDAVFQVVSLSTSTGYATKNFDLWPSLPKYLFLFAMIMGGCGGSTSAGLKAIRFFVISKVARRSVIQAAFPNAIMPIKVNGKTLSESLISGVFVFFTLYVSTLAIGTLLLLFFEGCDIQTASTAVITTLGGIGPGFGKVGPMTNYGWMSIPGKWVLSFMMLAGRVELYTMFLLFNPALWKK